MNTKPRKTSDNFKYLLIWILCLSIATTFILVFSFQKNKEIKYGFAAIPGDCGGPNGTPDGFVDLFDYGKLSRSFGLTSGQQGFNAACDFFVDSHNIIDLLDYGILAQNFGRTGTSISPTPPPSLAYYQTGWWVDQNTNTSLKTYYDLGQRFFLLIGCFETGGINYHINRLNEAQALGVKVILGFNCNENTPYNTSATLFASYINTLKNYPALYAYYIGDEPEWSDDPAKIRLRHGYLADNPGYYKIIKQNDPNHPVIISFNQPYDKNFWNTYTRMFYDVTDIIGVHGYPAGCSDSEWTSSYLRNAYDDWKYVMNDAVTYGKQIIATAKGFGQRCGSGSDYKLYSLAEARWQYFTAAVLGIKQIMFWEDDWGYADGYYNTVNTLVSQLQSVGAEMNNGITNDSRVGVSVTDRNQLTYRYGISGSSHAILAANIANRGSSSGATLSNVRFTLPSGISANQVTVVGENRTIPVTSGNFTDTFTRFQVHIYKF